MRRWGSEMPPKKYTITDAAGKTFERELTEDQAANLPEGFSASAIEDRAPEAPSAEVVPSTPFVDDTPQAAPGPPIPAFETFEDIEPQDDRNVFARAYDWVKRDLSKGLGTGVPPEVRGIAAGTTAGFAPSVAPAIVGGIQETLELMHPVDEPGLPPREFGGGRSTDPDRPIGRTLGAEVAQAEAREYEEAFEQEPLRTGVGYALGSAPLFAAAAPVLAEAGALRGAAGTGILGGAQALHTGDPVEVAKSTALGAGIPVPLTGAGRAAGAAEEGLRSAASRSRLAAATGQRPFGAAIKRLRKDKPGAMERMGEAVEESGMAGRAPIASQTTYAENVEGILQSSGEEIGAIQSAMRGSGTKVDLGPTIAALRTEGRRLRALPDSRAKAQGEALIEKADEYTAITVTRGKPPPTVAQAEKRADAIMSRAAKEQNEAIEAGRQLGTSPQEVIEQTDEIFRLAQVRADRAKAMVERPYETDYAKAHDLRKWLDNEAWNNRTGDAAASQWAREARDISKNVRTAIGDAIEEEAPQFAAPLRKANEAYEAASWVKQHADAGGGAGTSRVFAGGVGGMGLLAGDPLGGAQAGLTTFVGMEGLRRYGPGAAASGARALQRGAGGLSRLSPSVGQAAGLAAGTARGVGQIEPSAGPGPQSNPEVDRVLKMLETDPEAFGELSSGVKEAAEAGDIRRMRFIIARARQQEQRQQSIGATP